jgi:hypothetical protein
MITGRSTLGATRIRPHLTRPDNSRPRYSLNPRCCSDILTPAVNISKIIAELRKEREQIEETVLSLEKLARGRPRRTGRTSGWFPKRSDDPDEGSGGSSAEGAGVLLLSKRPRRPPKTGRASASIEDFEQHFGAGLRQRHESELVNDEQLLP